MERGIVASIIDQSEAAPATNPCSLVIASAMMDQAKGEPIQRWVANGGSAINHRDLKLSDATLDSTPKVFSKNPYFFVSVDENARVK